MTGIYNNIGGNGNDFEGYRIYRASDPAFQDAKVITNAQGSPTFKFPIAQFDLEDGIVGYDSVGFEGVHFNLGAIMDCSILGWIHRLKMDLPIIMQLLLMILVKRR